MNELTSQFTSHYFRVHVRRSDKGNEAKFYDLKEYMKHVDEFYDIYFLKYPHTIGKIQPTVYIASDHEAIFEEIKK